MNATIKLEDEKHFPVLLEKLISIISPLYGGTFIDCTFGQGGYSKEILKNKNNEVIALDRDSDTYQSAEKFEKKYNKRFYFENIKFSEINNLNKKINNLKGIIFDLGYSTTQIKNLNKGLSFLSKGKLNMKMGFNDFSASDVVTKLEQRDLSKIFSVFGEEKKSKIISKRIVELRKNNEIKTEDLVKIIDKVKKNKFSRIHNSTKAFQALRIFVNKEISELMYGLINNFKILPIGGIIVVITFHSLEDKIVKYFFRNYSEIINTSRYLPSQLKKEILFKLFKKKPILPDLNEIKKNPPSRSAKLRYGIKINDSSDFSEFEKKFEYLLSVENLGKKLWKKYH